MPQKKLKCEGCGAALYVSSRTVEKCYTCEDLAYCEGLEDGRSGVMKGEKRRFVEIDASFYERLRDYAKENQCSIRDAVTVIMTDFMKREKVVA